MTNVEVGRTHFELETLKSYMEQVAGEWNGDEAGIQEDNAHIANEVLEKIEEIRNLINEIN